MARLAGQKEDGGLMPSSAAGVAGSSFPGGEDGADCQGAKMREIFRSITVLLSFSSHRRTPLGASHTPRCDACARAARVFGSFFIFLVLF